MYLVENRNIAISVIGEDEPAVTDEMRAGFTRGFGHGSCRVGDVSSMGGWEIVSHKTMYNSKSFPKWEPRNFREDLNISSELVMWVLVDIQKTPLEEAGPVLEFDLVNKVYNASCGFISVGGYETAPEALCALAIKLYEG